MSARLWRFSTLSLLALALAACAEKTPAPTAAASEPAAAAPAPCGAEKAPEGHDDGEGCSGHDRTPPAHATVTRKDEAGRTVHHGGVAFVEAPAASVSDLLAKAGEHEGQLVEVTGNVSAMCYHGRGWFAVAAPDGSGAQLRVVTSPQFLVPQEAIGMVARVQGKVELIAESPAFARHLAEGHGLEAPADPNAPVRRPILRAVAAEFAEPSQP